MKEVIGIVGFKGSGKDSIGDYLVEKEGFIKDSFAAPLKDAASSIFSWSREMLEGATKESREQREIVDEWWAEKLGIEDLTPRLALQLMGTETLRGHFHKDIWILSQQNRILQSSNKKFVITDCRFPNELKTIKELGGYMIRIKRGPDPEWYETAKEANLGSQSALDKMVKEYKIHASERDWIGFPVDWVIENDGSLEELWLKMQKILTEIRTKQ